MALRILHTADWHLGHALHGFERTYEHERIVAWLLDEIVAREVDAVLVAGDVFEAANPPTEAQNLWFRFLVEAWRRSPGLQVVVVGGNHDSAGRLDATDPFLRALDRLHVVGGVTWRGDGSLDLDRLVVPLRDKAGTVAAWVAAVPFLRAAETGAGPEDAVAEGVRRFYEQVFAAARARLLPGQALLGMGHLYLTGAQVSELSERRLFAGNQSAIPHDVFPSDVAYAALGHLHLAQTVGGRDTVRYSGSLLPLSMDERRYRHEVVLVDLEGGRVVSLTPVAVPRYVEIRRIPEAGALSLPDALAALAALPARATADDGARPLLEVCVEVDHPEPTLRQAVEEALDGKAPRLARIAVQTKGSGIGLGDVETRPIAELSPEEVFLRKYEKDFGAAPPDDVLSAFHELLDAVAQEAA